MNAIQLIGMVGIAIGALSWALVGAKSTTAVKTVPAPQVSGKSRAQALVEIDVLMTYFETIGSDEGVKAMKDAANAALVSPKQEVAK